MIDRRFTISGLVLAAAVAAAACSAEPSSPLTPGARGAASTSAGAGGGPSSYDATGQWSGTFFVGTQQIGEGVHAFLQSPSGSMIAVGTEAPEDPERDWRVYSFKRIGSPNGTVRTFRLSIQGQRPGEPCATELVGEATLNTQTNVIEGTATGVIPNCATATVTIKWVKL